MSYDPIPPGHGELPVGAVPAAETRLDDDRPLRPPLAAPPSCPICWYTHRPEEPCPR